MAWGKKKNKIDDQYFARVEDSQIDWDNALIQEIVARVGGRMTETWPNVQLNDLQAFLSAVGQDAARASNRDVSVGTITYFEKDSKGKDEPNGLSWEDAIITAKFENIVVSTADHIFNSPAVRQDETADYDAITSSLNGLVDAALEYTTLSTNDMPEYPTEVGYRQARETDGLITVEAKKFQMLDASPTTAESAPDDEAKNEQPDLSVVQELPVPMANAVPNKEANNAKVEEDSQPTMSVNKNPFDTSHAIIDQVALETLNFPLADVPNGVPAEAADYVQSMLNADKVKANNFLMETSQMYVQQIRQALAEKVKQSEETLSSEVKQLRDTDVTESVDLQLSQERLSEFETRYQLRESARKAGFEADIKAENLRHETAVEALKNDYYSDLEELKVTINQELDAWYLERSGNLLHSIQASINHKIDDKTTQQASATMTSVKSLRDELLTQHNESLIALQDQLAEDIDKKRLGYKAEHEEALLAATKLETARSQSSHLNELEQQIVVLRNHNGELEDNLRAKETAHISELDKLNSENKTLTEQLRELKASSESDKADTTATTTDDFNHQVLTLLAAQLQGNQSKQPVPEPATKSKSGLSTFLIGAASALVIGGAAFGAYTLGSQSNASNHSISKKSATEPQQSSTALKASKAEQTAASTVSSATNSSQASSQSSNPLASQYHVGEDVKATINGQDVTARVNSIENHAITLNYNGQIYNVPFNN